MPRIKFISLLLLLSLLNVAKSQTVKALELATNLLTAAHHKAGQEAVAEFHR
jgi:hypothetical protein